MGFPGEGGSQENSKGGRISFLGFLLRTFALFLDKRWGNRRWPSLCCAVVVERLLNRVMIIKQAVHGRRVVAKRRGDWGWGEQATGLVLCEIRNLRFLLLLDAETKGRTKKTLEGSP